MGMLAPRIWQEKAAKPMSCRSSTWWKDVRIRRHCVSVQILGKAMASLGHKYLLLDVSLRPGPCSFPGKSIMDPSMRLIGS